MSSYQNKSSCPHPQHPTPEAHDLHNHRSFDGTSNKDVPRQYTLTRG